MYTQSVHSSLLCFDVAAAALLFFLARLRFHFPVFITFKHKKKFHLNLQYYKEKDMNRKYCRYDDNGLLNGSNKNSEKKK